MKMMIGLVFSLLLSFSQLSAQVFPQAELKTLDGETVNTGDYLDDDKITIVSFWATWCHPCKKELSAITEYYADWQAECNVQLIAVSIDNERSLPKAATTVETNGWDYIVLSDAKQELMKQLNFQTIPQTFLLDKDGNIVYDHNGYEDGDEAKLGELITQLAAK